MNNIKFQWASQFIAHHKSYIGHNSVSDRVRRTIIDDTDLRREVGLAFRWRSTKEGYDYWRAIAASW